MGLAQKSKSQEPSDVSSISETKTKAKQSLKTRPSKPVPTATDAFDYLVNTFRGKPNEVQPVPKVKHSLKSNIIRGIHDINQITEEISKNGNIQRIKAQQEADIAGLRSANRHFKGSIAACANSKKGITAGSLVTQRTIGTRTNTQAVIPYPTQNQVIPKIVHRKGGDQVRYFLPTGKEVSAAVARKLLNGTVPALPKAIEASTTAIQANPTYNTGTIAKKPVNRMINKQKVATCSGLVRRTHSGVV
jgi:hypothetical protein